MFNKLDSNVDSMVALRKSIKHSGLTDCEFLCLWATREDAISIGDIAKTLGIPKRSVERITIRFTDQKLLIRKENIKPDPDRDIRPGRTASVFYRLSAKGKKILTNINKSLR